MIENKKAALTTELQTLYLNNEQEARALIDKNDSKMLLGVQIRPVGYMKIDEIPALIKDFLEKIKQAN